MASCWKCRAVVPEGEECCSNCGCRIGGFDNPGKDNELIKKLNEYRLLLDEYEYIVSTVKPQDNFPQEEEQTAFKKRSFFRYFWPFLVIAAAVSYGVGILSNLLLTFRKDITSLLLGALLCIIADVAIIVFGYKVAKRKQAENNHTAETMSSIAQERYNLGLANKKKIDRLAVLEEKKAKLDPLVPEGFRDFDHVAKIQELIMQNKASTIEEACALIKA